MKQIGIIEKLIGDTCKISVIRETACGENCASCSSKCSLKNQFVFAQNKNFEVGDRVVFEMPTSKIVFAAFLVYVMPIIIFFGAYFLFYYLGFEEAKNIGFSFMIMALWFVVVKLIDKKLLNKYKHNILYKL